MIIVRRLNGQEFALNSDLIETIEENPDTTIRTTDKRFYIVKETMREVVDLVVEFRQRCYERPLQSGNGEELKKL